MSEANSYLRRFAFCQQQIAEPPSEALRMVVVIPCHNEPDLCGALNALEKCDPAECAVEIIAVINSSETAAEQILNANQCSLEQAQAWNEKHRSETFQLHTLSFPALPKKHAGVGLARKIGIDEAVRRLDAADAKEEGVIVCFDADCACDSNFLASIEEHFKKHPKTPGCSIYFEHPLEGQLSGANYEAIAKYELHLRYYIAAQRFAGFPKAYQTVGSSMAVRSSAYQKQGGMNRRQAGEDFYFLHKIIALGNFTELSATRVIPSSRVSDRVPFGTGKAVGDLLESAETNLKTYPLRAFRDLRGWFECAEKIATNQLSIADAIKQQTNCMREFLTQINAPKALNEIKANTATPKACHRRFFDWFDAFVVMKFVHHARDNFYGNSDITTAATELLELTGRHLELEETSARELLKRYRDMDRCEAFSPPSL